MASKKTLIIGIGNPNMGDDGIGIEIAKEIKRQNSEVEIEIFYYISFGILDKMLGYDEVFVIDAADIGYGYGDVLFFRYTDLQESLTLLNSHGISLYHIIKTGYEIFESEMPKELNIILIQTEKIDKFQNGITNKLKNNIPSIIQEIKNRYKSLIGGNNGGQNSISSM